MARSFGTGPCSNFHALYTSQVGAIIAATGYSACLLTCRLLTGPNGACPRVRAPTSCATWNERCDKGERLGRHHWLAIAAPLTACILTAVLVSPTGMPPTLAMKKTRALAGSNGMSVPCPVANTVNVTT